MFRYSIVVLIILVALLIFGIGVRNFFLGDTTKETEELTFNLLQSGTSTDCRYFLEEYPESMFKRDVENLLNLKLEEEAYNKARTGGSLECENFLRNFPTSDRVKGVKLKFLSLPILTKTIDCANVYSIDASPDGELFAIASTYESDDKYNDQFSVFKGELKVFNISDLRNPKLIFKFKPNDMARIDCVRFSQNGKLLGIGTGLLDKLNDFKSNVEVILFDVSNQTNIKKLAEITDESPGLAHSLDFSPNGKYIAFGNLHLLIIADISNLEKAKVIDKPYAHDWIMQVLEYSADGEYIVSCSAKKTDKYNEQGFLVYEGEFKLWKTTETGEVWEASSTLCHDRTTLSVAFSNNGKYLASGSYNKELKIWNISDLNKIVKSAEILDLSDMVCNLQFSRDGEKLIFSTSGIINICEVLESGIIEIDKLLECKNFITDLTFARNDALIIACTNTEKLYIWPTEKYVEKLLKRKD